MKACSVCGRRTIASNRCARHQKPRPYGTLRYRLARARTLAEEPLCWICCKPGTPNDPLTADHVVPVAHGGGSDRGNLRAAHLSCNSRRGQRLQEAS